MYARISIPLTALFVIGVLLAGCGDDDNGDATADGSTAASGASNDGSAASISSQAEFIDEANAACAARQREMQANFEPILERNLKNVPDAVLAKELVDEAASGLEAQIRDIRALGPPPENGKQLEALLAAIQKLVSEAKEDPATFVKTRERPYLKTESMAAKYGLTACGSPS